MLRFSIRNARGLQRPRTELDSYPPEYIAALEEDDVARARSPSAFAVITVDDREMYSTFEIDNAHDPDWEESFDMKVDDLSIVVIRVFDMKCINKGWPSFIGFTTVHPFTALPHPNKAHLNKAHPNSASAEEISATESGLSQVDLDAIPLVREDTTVPDMSVSISISTDTKLPPSLPTVPLLSGPQETRVQRRVTLVKFGNKKVGRKKETTTTVYQMAEF